MRKMLTIILAFGLLIFSISILPVSADVVGQTYSYDVVYYQESTQIDNDPEFDYTIRGQFQVYVYNISELGGDDVINYNYKGYVIQAGYTYFDFDNSVDFQDHKVYWTISTTDSNMNNISEDTDIIPRPTEGWFDWGEHIFVNPIWSTHESDWNAAIEEVEDDNTSTLVSQAIGDGSFAFQIEIAMEDFSENLNGTRTYTYTSSFDEDGVLLNMEIHDFTNWFNENITRNVEWVYKLTRIGGIGAGLDLTAVAAVGAIGVGALVVGLLIGRRIWG